MPSLCPCHRRQPPKNVWPPPFLRTVHDLTATTFECNIHPTANRNMTRLDCQSTNSDYKENTMTSRTTLHMPRTTRLAAPWKTSRITTAMRCTFKIRVHPTPDSYRKLPVVDVSVVGVTPTHVVQTIVSLDIGARGFGNRQNNFNVHATFRRQTQLADGGSGQTQR